jgi:hypothetical protein
LAMRTLEIGFVVVSEMGAMRRSLARFRDGTPTHPVWPR